MLFCKTTTLFKVFCLLWTGKVYQIMNFWHYEIVFCIMIFVNNVFFELLISGWHLEKLPETWCPWYHSQCWTIWVHYLLSWHRTWRWSCLERMSPHILQVSRMFIILQFKNKLKLRLDNFALTFFYCSSDRKNFANSRPAASNIKRFS